jgi:hypothetical protein
LRSSILMLMSEAIEGITACLFSRQRSLFMQVAVAAL